MPLPVDIEFCAESGYQEEATRLQAAIERRLGERVTVTLREGRPESFEVTSSGGSVIHSKLLSGDLPDAAFVISTLEKQLGTPGMASASSTSALAPGEASFEQWTLDIDKTLTENQGATALTGNGDPTMGKNYYGDNAEKQRNKLMPSRCLPLYLRFPLFWFPYNVDQTHSRFISSTVCILCVIVAISFRSSWAPYLCACIFADYCLRVLFGGRASLIGGLTAGIAHHFPVRQYPGPPKQFAQMVGMMFSGAATLAFWLSVGDDDVNEIVGLVIILGLAGAAFLDGFVGFCLGCFMFRMALMVLPKKYDATEKSSVLAEEFTETTSFLRADTRDADGTRIIKYAPLDTEKRVPLVYKVKNEDFKKSDFSLVRHVYPPYLFWPVAALGLAACWRLTAQTQLDTPRGVWVALTIYGLVVLAAITLLLAVQWFFYSRKFYKAWNDPNMFSGFAGFPLCLALFAFILATEWEDKTFVKVLFWLAALSMALLTVIVVGRWIQRMHYRSSVSPSWVIVPVGNLLVAAVGPAVDSAFVQISFLWFSTGVVFFVVLLTMVMQRLIVGYSFPDPMRSSVWVLLAAPAVAGLAWARLNALTAADSVFLFFTFFSLMVFFILVGLIVTSYFGRDRFSMSYWSYCFPLAALAMAFNQFYAYNDSDWSEFAAVSTLCIATYIQAIVAALTLSGIISRTDVFVPPVESGPGSLTVLMHHAFREALEKLVKMSKKINKPEVLMEFGMLWARYDICLEEHSSFEEKITFPLIDEFYPGLTSGAHEQHEVADKLSQRMTRLLDTIVPEARQKVLQQAHLPLGAMQGRVGTGVSEQQMLEIQALMQDIASFDNKHFAFEEEHLKVVGTKHFNFKLAKETARKIWFNTEVNKWRVIVPFMVCMQKYHSRRLQFLKALQPAIPERFQLVGRMVYENVDELMWDRLRVDVPDMAPRETAGYHKFF
eukprot:m.151598 g.151598  ORF g.151598 m.151598 type:complete len:944 (-) comp20701_c0_seq6:67-2898(-)